MWQLFGNISTGTGNSLMIQSSWKDPHCSLNISFLLVGERWSGGSAIGPLLAWYITWQIWTWTCCQCWPPQSNFVMIVAWRIQSNKAILPLEDDSTKTKLLLPCLRRLCHDNQNKSLYNEETITEFYHLLVATMLYYARALGDLDKAENKMQKNIAASLVLRLTRLLNAIMVSGVFQRHITFLVQQNLLHMPSDQQQFLFHRFAVKNAMPWVTQHKLRDGSDRSGKPDSGDRTNDQDSEDTTNDQESEDAMNDQDPFFIGTNHWEDISIAIQGWVKLFVQHFHAKRILESFAKSRGSEISIDIKVFGVKNIRKTQIFLNSLISP